MTLDEIKAEIEKRGWKFQGYENKVYKSIWPYLVHIIQEGSGWDVTGTFWGKTRKQAAEAALAWAKERGE